MLWAKNPRAMQVQRWQESTQAWVVVTYPSWDVDKEYRVVPKEHKVTLLQHVQDGQAYCYHVGNVVYTRFSIPAENFGNSRSNTFDRSFGMSNDYKLDTCKLAHTKVYLVP